MIVTYNLVHNVFQVDSKHHYIKRTLFHLTTNKNVTFSSVGSIFRRFRFRFDAHLAPINAIRRNRITQTGTSIAGMIMSHFEALVGAGVTGTSFTT